MSYLSRGARPLWWWESVAWRGSFASRRPSLSGVRVSVGVVTRFWFYMYVSIGVGCVRVRSGIVRGRCVRVLSIGVLCVWILCSIRIGSIGILGVRILLNVRLLILVLYVRISR